MPPTKNRETRYGKPLVSAVGRGLKLRLRISKVHVNPAVSWERAEMEKGHEGMTLSEHFLPYNIPPNRKQTIV